MITDLEIIQLVNSQYGHPGSPPVAWDHLDDGTDNDGVYWSVVTQGGFQVVVLRGSVTTDDFLKDAEAAFWNDRDLGGVHMGFLQGMKDVWSELEPMLKGSWVACGHSLGAGRADILTALGVVHGKPPASRVVFGEPRPGFAKMCALAAQVPGRSYRNRDFNGHDVITDVPFTLPPLYPYTRPTPLIDVSESPAPDDGWSAFRYHHAELYEKALLKLNPLSITG